MSDDLIDALWQLLLYLVGSGLLTLLAITVHRRLKLSDGARNYWLASWWLVGFAAPAAAALFAQLSVRVEPALPLLAEAKLVTQEALVGVSLAPAVGQSSSWGWAVLWGLYFVGAARALAREWRGHRRLRSLLAEARPIARACWAGPRSRYIVEQLERQKVALLQLEHAVSPFALGGRRPSVVLPTALLASLSDHQLSLVLKHEWQHLKQRDPAWAAVMRWLAALLWFNPWLKPLAQRMRIAAELRCDVAALAGEKNMRRAYAEAYLQTLRMSMTEALQCPVTAFSPHDLRSHHMRIAHIVHGDPRRSKHPLINGLLIGAGLAASAGLGAVHAAASQSPEASRLDGSIVDGRISAGFGAVPHPKSPHRGIDLSAPLGTPIRAPGAGVVQTATERYPKGEAYGSVVVIDHGNGVQTIYAHLGAMKVKAGEQVNQGQVLAEVGMSGQTTGPHVHVEVLVDGNRVDPAQWLSQPIATR